MVERSPLRTARIVLGIGVVAAILPALLVVLRVEPVPTMIVPVVLAALPLAARRRFSLQVLSLLCGLLLVVFVILGGFSVGFLFAPSALAVLVAGLLARESARAAV